MTIEDIVKIIFEDVSDIETILDDTDASDLHGAILEYGFSSKRFLYVDYKGEEGNEIVNYILDYEFNHNLELVSQEELEELEEFEYEFLPEKISEANKILSKKGYGLFSYPTAGDCYALFIAKLEHKSQLTGVELLDDEYLPAEAKLIQYYRI